GHRVALRLAVSDRDVEEVLEERELPVDRGRRDGSRLLALLVVIAAQPAREPFGSDLLEIGRGHLLETPAAEPLGPGLPVTLVIPEGALARLRRGQVLLDHVGDEVVDGPGLASRAWPLQSLALDLLRGEALRSHQRPMEMAMRAGPADPPVADLALTILP